MRNKRIIGQIGTWMIIAILMVLAWWVVMNYSATEGWIRQAGWWGPFIAICLYILLSLTPIPTDPLTLLVCALFGWGWGFFISWMGNNAAALTEYLISRTIRDATRFETQKKKLPKWLQGVPVTSLWFLIGVRIMPGVGGKIVGVMSGVYGVSVWRFVWTSALANVIGSALYALGGWSLVKRL